MALSEEAEGREEGNIRAKEVGGAEARMRDSLATGSAAEVAKRKYGTNMCVLDLDVVTPTEGEDGGEEVGVRCLQR